MEWKKFEESKLELPDILIRTTVSGFSDATSGLLYLEVAGIDPIEKFRSNQLKSKFQFRVTLHSKRLPDYSLNILDFGYGVTLYPVKMILLKVIRDELSGTGDQGDQIFTIESEENLKELLSLVFSTTKFQEIVSGLMKISQSISSTW